MRCPRRRRAQRPPQGDRAASQERDLCRGSCWRTDSGAAGGQSPASPRALLLVHSLLEDGSESPKQMEQSAPERGSGRGWV